MSLLLVFGGYRVHAADAPVVVDMACPVTTDEAADPAFWLDYEGRRVYFCCRKCRAEFQNNPEPYLANLPVHDTHAMEDVGSEQADHDSSPAEPDHTRGHDHSTHAAETRPGKTPLTATLGKLHPVLVHFPIALLLVALLAELLHVATAKAVFIHASRFLLPVAAASAVVAAGFGWLAGETATYTGVLAETLSNHRWTGVATAAVALIAAGLQWAAVKRDTSSLRWAYRIALLVGCVLVSVAGHLGASLIYGLDYFPF